MMTPFFNWFLKDKDGKVVIGQWPNWPIWLALILYLLRFFPWESFSQVSRWGVFFTMMYWSYLEIRYGVNGFRRTLGVFVMIFMVYGILT
jgi:hypothetical protein